jgi:hypothetical protein
MKKKKSKWLTFEEAALLLADRGKLSKSAAADLLAKGIEDGKVTMRVAPTEVELKGIDVMIDSGVWTSLRDACLRLAEERGITGNAAAQWIRGQLADKKMRWRAKQVSFNGYVLSPIEAERFLVNQGGEYASWKN